MENRNALFGTDVETRNGGTVRKPKTTAKLMADPAFQNQKRTEPTEKVQLRVLAASLATALRLNVQAAEPLTPGLYEITVRVAMPNLGDAIQPVTQRRCITAAEAAGSTPFQVLSTNNPLAQCPREDEHAEGRIVTFRIVCRGPDKASAMATFEVGDAHYQGRFVMNMGGKNMTMSEQQDAVRIGPCS